MAQIVGKRIVHVVPVTGHRTLKEALNATKREHSVDDSADTYIQACGEGYEVKEITFVNLGKYVMASELRKAIEDLELGLELEDDFYILAAIHEADPTFADWFDNGTQKTYEDGACISITFGGVGNIRRVNVSRLYFCDGWGGNYSFPCRYKKAP